MIYANTAAVGQITRETAEVAIAWYRRLSEPDFYTSAYPELELSATRCRAAVCALLRSSCSDSVSIGEDDIALVSSTSEGVAIATEAAATRLKTRKNVAINYGSFISTRVQCISLQRRGHVCVEVGEPWGEVTPDHLSQVEGLGLVVLDHVNYVTGFKNELASIARYCDHNGIILVVDAVQSLGVARLDCDLSLIDAVACGGHKWLRGSEGTGFLFMNPRLASAREHSRCGYRSLQQPTAFDQDLAESSISMRARGVEIGTRNSIGFAAFAEAMDSLMQKGMACVFDHFEASTGEIVSLLGKHPAVSNIVTPSTPLSRAGIVAFRAREDPLEVVSRLRTCGITCGQRKGLVRLSPSWDIKTENLLEGLDHALSGL